MYTAAPPLLQVLTVPVLSITLASSLEHLFPGRLPSSIKTTAYGFQRQLAAWMFVFFSSNGGASVTHVGVYIGNGQFVHASTSSVGVIISDLGSAYYTKVWYGAKRIV